MRFTAPTADDLDPLIASMREFYASERLPFDETVARRALTELIGSPWLGLVRIIDAGGGAPAGYFVLTFGFSLEFGGRLAWLDELYVRAPFRRRGVARAVLQFAQEVCRGRGIDALRLEVDRENIAAETLYRSAGFQDPRRDILTLRIAPRPRQD